MAVALYRRECNKMGDATAEFSSVTVGDSSTLPALNIVRRHRHVKMLYIVIAATLTLLDETSRAETRST